MRLYLLTFLCLLFAFPANAYLEEHNDDEVEATAGEQNTNLYSLNAATDVRMKQLKKISAAMARNPNADYANSDAIEQILSGKSEVDLDVAAQLQKLQGEVSVRLSDKKILIVAKDELIRRLQDISRQIKDKEAANVLGLQIRRRK